MDISEFKKKVKPKAKKSQMEPYRAQILDLKKSGYADDQVKEWLALNGLVVSRQAVQQFVKKEANTAPKVGGNSQATPDILGGEPTGGTETVPVAELSRPPGISNSAWSEMQVKHNNLNRK